MKRFIGQTSRKPREGKMTIDDAADSMDKRIDHINSKIEGLDTELLKYKKQLKTMRPGAAQQSVKQRAMKVLQQKKMYEAQRDQMYNQSFNLDQTKFAVQSVQDAQIQVKAMQTAAKALKKQTKGLDLDKVERMRDRLEELMDDSNEITEILGRSYDLGDSYVDEDDLEAELAGLESEMDDELALGGGDSSAIPSYLSEAPAAPTGRMDEHGLPQALHS